MTIAGKTKAYAHFVDRAARRVFRRAILWATRSGEHFVTYNERPKLGARIGTWSEPAIHVAPSAIVMQGPIATDDDFTVETLRLYRRNMPSCLLILSTWQDTPESQLAPIRDLGVDVVLSPRPANPGPFNVNMQLVSASNGVRHAVDRGAEWVMKTRTDQRLYDPNALGFLQTLAKAFPVATGFDQRYRIIGVGHGSLKFAPYHMTDQTVFGHAQDMLTYWTPPLREGKLPEHWPADQGRIFSEVPIGEMCRHAAAETYLTSNFLERVGRRLDWTLADSWTAYRDHFAIADSISTDFYWVKGQTYSLRETLTAYDMVSNRRDLTFSEWFMLYSGQLPAEAANNYAHVLNDRFNMPVRPPA